MNNFFRMGKNELLEQKEALNLKYKEFQKLGLKLNMSRGVPSTEQINLSAKMLDCINSKSDCTDENGKDCRNYGGAYGIPEARRLLAQMMNVNEENVIAGGNSSLQMMFDAVSMFMTHGASGCPPWIKQGKIKFLCPAPGYDRHFKISEYFGMELITVNMTENGPDMDMVENLVNSDPSVKGIWCVPKYSNPQGIVYSDETVKRLASLQPRAKDFRIFWDNAYSVHDLSATPIEILNIMDECVKIHNENLPIMFCSLSKITLAGAAIAGMACSGDNLRDFKLRYSIQSVGPDKVNQLRHVRFLNDIEGIRNHMKKHRKILEPKFSLVINKLKENFSDNPVIKWQNPKGGYFVSVDLLDGCAKRTVELCKNAGVILTDAGATYPYGVDPKDSNIRIAPSFPDLKELSLAMDIFCVSVKLSCLEKLL